MFARITLNNKVRRFQIDSIPEELVYTSGEPLDNGAWDIFVDDLAAAEFLEEYNIERGVALWTYEDAFEFFASVVNPDEPASPFEFWGGWGSGMFDLTQLIPSDRITLFDEDEDENWEEED
jgi:hypothetical protein